MKTKFNNSARQPARFDARRARQAIQQFSNKGFTLLELIIVFSVISILSTIGIASFVNYSRAQSFQTASASLASTLSLAKSHANSQVKPSQCANEALSGYRVDILSNTTYSLSAVCLGTYLIQTTTLPDNGNIKFNFASGQTTTTSIFFPIITSGVYGAGNIVLTGHGQAKTITVNPQGIITLGKTNIVITPTPTPTPTISTPTPTGSGVPLPTPTPVPTSTYSQTILNTTGLVSHWRLGEASGNPQDSKGTNHVTVVGGTPTYGQTGAIVGDSNTAITFDGSTEYFTVPDAASLDLGDGPFTLEAWTLRTGVDTAQHQIISKGTNAYDWSIDNNRNRFAKGNVAEIVQGNTSLAANVWHHLVITKNGSTTKLYVDGVDNTGTVTNATLSNTADALTLGKFGSGLFFNGRLDEVAIYNTVLSGAIVLDHYNRGVAPPSTPTPTPVSGLKTVTVSSIAALKTNLADNTVDEIVVTNGTYTVQGATSQQANSLYIGASYASRTRPITVRAETQGGVTFSGGNMTYFNALNFVGGAHDQTWDGFKFADGYATDTGVVIFGGPNRDNLTVGPHHITLRNIIFTNTLHGYAYDPTRSNVNDHAIYFSDSYGGTHDILFENVTVQGATTNPIHTAFHFYTHGFGITGVYGAYNVVMRNFNISGVNDGVIFWDDLSHDIRFEDSTITNSRFFAIRYEEGLTTSNIVLKNITSIGSGQKGFYSSQGTNPPGVTFIDTNLN